QQAAMASRAKLLQALDQMAELMQLDGANTFKVNAYSKAVRVLGDETIDIGAAVANGKLTDIDGIGKGIAEKITEFWNTGRIEELEELRSKFPDGLIAMTSIQGFGPKKARAVYDELGIASIDELVVAC